MTPEKQEERKKMYENQSRTTTLGLKSDDGVVLATESQASMGYLVADKYAEKIIPLQDHIAITISGGVGDAQILGRIMKAQTNIYQLERKRKMDVDSAATLLANVLQGRRMLPYYVSLIMGGYDEEPRLYSLDALGSKMEKKAVASGSGSPIAYGVLENYYDEENTTEENLKIAIKAIHAAKERDSMSGGRQIHLMKITDKGSKKYTEEEIEELKKDINLRKI
ncbi:MAG: archaeal proteasome endopeptidase complex subunit beta [archaeon]